jgi:small-conductance mechanosensitive channel
MIEPWLENPLFGRIISLLLVLLGLHLLLWLGRRALLARIKSSETRYRLRKAFNIFVFLLTTFVVAWFFGDRFGNLSVAFGVAGAGIAFALQEVIASFAGWVAISLGGFYSTGDRVQLGGIVGDVIDIGVLRTTLMETGQWIKGDLYSGRIVLVANSFVFKEPVFNYSGDFPFLWDEITVPIKHGSDHRLARQMLQKVATHAVGEYVPKVRGTWDEMQRKYLLEEASIEPAVTVVANDNWLEYTIRYVVDFKRRRSTKDRLFESILDALDETDGRVALASTTVHLVEAPIFKVRLENSGKE